MIFKYPLAAVLFASLTLLAPAADPTPPPAPVSPPAAPAGKAALLPSIRTLLDGTAKYYAAHQTFEADLASVTKMDGTGMKQEFDNTFHLALQRPNLAALTLQSGMLGGSMASNGKKLITLMPMAHKYTSDDAPAQLSGVFDPMRTALALGGFPLGFESFLQADPVASLAKMLSKSEDLGPDPIAGQPAHHVRLTGTPYTVDFWIADGATPQLLQAQLSMDMSAALKNLPAAQKSKMPAGFSSMKMSRLTTYSNWKIDQPIAASTFEVKPPADFTVMKSIGAGAGAEKAQTLTGKLAPDFNLKDGAGKSVPLQSLRGKVVVLDFWATWCGPCGESLPVLAEVTNSFKDKGIVFYAVNEQEDLATIQKFQADKKLTFPILLDADGKAGQRYQATAIPETVLIDKTGKIQSVHVGYDPEMKTLLTQQLTDLLAGKELAPAKSK